MRPLYVAGGVLLGVAALYLIWYQTEYLAADESEDGGAVQDSWADIDGGGELSNGLVNGLLEGLDSWSGGLVKTSSMRKVSPDEYLQNANVKAVLRVIRAGEGTADDAGYSRLYGGGQFSGFSDHPRVKVTKWGRTSTAAGAYQFLAGVWDETRAAMGLADFSPVNQDRAAVGRLAARGALADAVRGNFDAVMTKINKEWASMPGSPYGQGGLSLAKARAIFADAGGSSGVVNV